MTIRGKISKINNLVSFLASYSVDPSSPSANGGIKNLRVTLLSVKNYPLPKLSVRDTTDNAGNFSLSVTAARIRALPPSARLYFLVEKQVGTLRFNGMDIPLYGPVYRSKLFKPSALGSGPVNIYIHEKTLPKEQGIQQEAIDDQANEIEDRERQISSLHATIHSTYVSVRAHGNGAAITFKIRLKPYTGEDLSQYMTFEMYSLDVDLPGIDLFTQLCISQSDIEANIKRALRDMSDRMNEDFTSTLISGVASSTGMPAADVTAFLNDKCTISFPAITFPLIRTVNERFPGLPMPIPVKYYAILPKLSLGFPRKIF